MRPLAILVLPGIGLYSIKHLVKAGKRDSGEPVRPGAGIDEGRRERLNLMKVKMILPALTEAKSPFFRPVKYSLFPPPGLATLAGYFDEDVEVVLQDEHV